MTIAVDFDGTIVEDKYPEIGNERPGAISTLRCLHAQGYTLILWTSRRDIALARAVLWCAERGLKFQYINESTDDDIRRYGGDTRKVGASLYIDDRGLIPIPDWDEIYRIVHERVPTRSDQVINEGYL